MASESVEMDCSETDEAASVQPSIKASDLPVETASTETEAETEQKDETKFEEMSLEPSNAASQSKESEKPDATEQDKSITDITSEEKTEESSIIKLDSAKLIETDFDSSVELISSPISEQIEAENNKGNKSSIEESDAAVEGVGPLMDSTDAAKSTEDDLDSSIELIESPVLKELTETDNTKDSKVDSDSSIEVISSPGNTEDNKKDTTVSKTDCKESIDSIPNKDGVDIEEKQTITNKDIITVSNINTKDTTAMTVESDSAMQTKSTIVEEPITPKSTTVDEEAQQTDESSNIQKELLIDEPMETESCQEQVESICLVKIQEEDYTETKPGDNRKESVDYEEDNEIYYKKDCLNCNCEKQHKQYVRASLAALNYYKVPRKAHKRQYICIGCYDTAIDMYEVSR